MRVFFRIALFVSCIFLSFSGVAQEKPSLGSTIDRDLNRLSPKTPVVDPNAPEKDRTETIREAVNLRGQIAQLMFVRLGGDLALSSEDRQLLRSLHPGGVIISDVTRANRAREYTNSLLDLENEAAIPVPFFIACNMFETQEQFSVSISQQFLPISTPLAISASGNNDDTSDYVNGLAADLATLGINVHLGPTLQIHSPETNIKYAVQTFGSGVKQSVEMSQLFAEAFEEHSIAWAPVGFPGGLINAKGPSVLVSPKDQFIRKELLPYEAAVRSGVSMIHVGNTLTPQLDRSNIPSSISPIIIKAFLRGYAGFDGVVVAGPADDRIMENQLPPHQAAVAILKAGADMVLWDKFKPHLIDAIDAIEQAVIRGDIPPQQIFESYQRVMNLKEELGLFERDDVSRRTANKVDIQNIRDSLSTLIERRSITLLKNNNGLLPLTKEKAGPIGVTGFFGVGELHSELQKPFKDISRQFIVSAEHSGKMADFDVTRVQRRTGNWKTVICIFDPLVDLPRQKEVLRFLGESGKQVVVILLGLPEKISDYYHADSVLLAYSQRNNLKLTMKAVRDVIIGEGPVDLVAPNKPLTLQAKSPIEYDVYDMLRNPSGQLPVSIGKEIPLGYSLSYRSEKALKKVAWDFGDGKTSKSHNGNYLYKEPGEYYITLTIKTEDGDEKTEQYPARVLK
jgi:beta-N-acetylhexosaminidase